MSADNLESIEENGDYWLSKSNTAYHIINPNATNLTTIEANGYYSLAKGGDTYYVLDGSGSSIRLYYDGVGRSMFGPHDSTGIYTPTNVEENPFDSGFLVLVYRNDKPEWNNSSFFNYNNFGFEFDTLGKYAGSDLKTVNNHAFPRPGIEYEPVFGLDLNDDDNIATGANPPNLLNISTIQHHIDDGHVNDGIILKRDSVTIDPNSYAGWSATQVIASVGEGYEVLWSHSSKYDVWKFDTSGNFVSSIKAKLWQDEEKFNLDLNGDGDTGLQPVEEIGGVHLKHGDNTYNGAPQYYIVDGSNAPIGLNVGGAPRGPTDGDWNVTQVEDSGTGYEVFWSHNSGKFQVWKVDSSGSYETKVTAHLWQHENTFEVDLNGDGVQGLRTIETIGDVHLALGDNGYSGDTQYYIVDGSNAPIGLSVRGAPRGPTDGDWNVTQVEDSGTGYEVFWSHNSGKFQVWKVDSSGSYETKVTAHLWQHENTFEVDLNGDGIDSGNNDIYGSIGNDTFDGGAGDDIINGREGHDTLIGGEGNDWISGDGGSGYAGNDILFGNAGNDDLRGRGGNDQIDGGAGSDTITTGSGFDKIILRIGDGGNTLSDADIITDFTDGIDKLRLDGGLLFSQDMINQGTGAYASDTIISKGSEYLAILQGIDVSLLSDTDFETVDIA
jgi:Ca2+-binding RTX toxin-like protein